ncbi:MAG: beta-ketoacyl synthase N-terminal-like domain-containing protein [Candidatus Wallbacteria bacterium]|nr:beta-ketoacyl synthase N-terminal-like domain-containing protein [Candidatus Wallbacteria bacterium]
MKRRVAVTGIGMISPYGVGREINWSSLLAGKTAYGELDFPEKYGIPFHTGGKLTCFEPEKYISQRKLLKYMNREMQMSVVTALEAASDSGLAVKEVPPESIGIYLGTGITSVEIEEILSIAGNSTRDGRMDLERFGSNALPKCDPLLSFKTLLNMPACFISILLGIRGQNLVFNSFGGQVLQSISEAFLDIESGQLESAIAGGVDAKVSFTGFMTLKSFGLINQNASASKPFGTHRKGMIVSEGGACLMLENLENAQRRKAKVYAELIGASTENDLDSGFIPRKPLYLVNTLNSALNKAGLKPGEIDCILSGACSDPCGDAAEAAAITEVFGSNNPQVCSVKGYTGDFIAGAGTFDLAGSALMLNEQTIPPGFDPAEIDTDLNLNLAGRNLQKKKIDTVLCTAFSGGNPKTCFILRRCP